MYASLSLTGVIEKEVGEGWERLTPEGGPPVWTGFGGGGVRVDPSAGRIMLAPGAVYAVTVSGAVRLRYTSALRVMAVLGSDPRFRSAGALVEHTAARMVAGEVRELGYEFGRHGSLSGRDKPWDRTATRTFSGTKLIRIPAGPEPVPVEAWARPESSRREPGDAVQFIELELSVIGVEPTGGVA